MTAAQALSPLANHVSSETVRSNVEIGHSHMLKERQVMEA